ncbi:MAG: aminotransferase class III-fold pyridoxal phosphate-dependent enzyme [Caldisericum exile]|uniref:aminotransferase class III-fold pyridoxal phosphate-dependent enzyme n=1 Tax=Caldisericum exile TaxID=693075 RepID=UPI003C7671F4
MIKILAILQARVSSTRLPGKVLKPILGKPMLALQIERILQSKKIEKLVVATSSDASDDKIEDLCNELKLPCFRGKLDDVLDRFYQASLIWQPEHIVRLTGDCPLIDPDIIDQLILFYLDGDYDYVSNALEPTFPDGLDVEIFRYFALEEAWKEAKLPSQREHVTPFINSHPDKFKIANFKNHIDLSHHRWTVDEPEDFELIKIIYEKLYPHNPNFRMSDILKFLENHPELIDLNKKFKRNEGYEKSLKEDRRKEAAERFNLRQSLSLQEHARTRIPGLSQLLSKRPDLFSYGIWPCYFTRAKGVEIWDLDGNHYIDMSISGIGANVLGYADPDVDKAVKEAIDKGVSSSLNCPEEVELADLLCELHPWAQKVRFARTGGEAMAIAVRIARAYTERDKIAFCGYHGWHDWYLSANIGTENALGEHLLPGLNPAGVPKVLKNTAIPFRYNRIDELETILNAHKREIAAIVMEPIRNENPFPGFLDEIKRLSKETGAVLIIDEISSGFRMNTGGAHIVLGIEPDIAVFSKALGNGYAIAAIIGKSEVMDAAQKTFISSTNWTERIGPVAAIAMIKKHRACNVGKHLMKIGELVQEGWKTISEKHGIPIHIGGIPPLSHFVFDHEKALVLKALFIQLMLEKGFLASNIFYAMYAHMEEHVRKYLLAVDEAFAFIKNAIDSGEPEKHLLGEPSTAGFKRLN